MLADLGSSGSLRRLASVLSSGIFVLGLALSAPALAAGGGDEGGGLGGGLGGGGGAGVGAGGGSASSEMKPSGRGEPPPQPESESGIQIFKSVRVTAPSSLMNATSGIREDGQPHSGQEFRSTG
jgi:hypothetical protein